MSSNTVITQRIFSAPVEKVWRAWTDPEQMKHWFAPEHMSTGSIALSLKVGGQSVIQIKGPHGETYINHGIYKEIIPCKKLVFLWQWENEQIQSEVTVMFNQLSATQTEVILTHIFPEEKDLGMHKEGWESIFDTLAHFLMKGGE